MTTFADKIAEKAFRSKKIQQSWEVHVRAFGPILTEAFCENEQARIHLTNALNQIYLFFHSLVFVNISE